MTRRSEGSKKDSGSGGSVEQRIFVVGVPRSGTTLVQSLLAAHPAVTSFSESHFFSRYFAPRPFGPLLIRDPTPRVLEFLRENGAEDALREEGASLALGIRGPRVVLPLRTRAVARRLVEVLDTVALSRGAPIWVEKTPRHLLYLSFLESLLGDATDRSMGRLDFVHVVREGVATVASLSAASREWPTPYDLRASAERWNRDLRRSLDRVGSPRDHFVLYEELAERPEPTVRRLLESLGLEWRPEVLTRYGETAQGLIAEEESWKSDVDRPIARSSAELTTLDAREREQVRGWLQEELYERLASRSRSRAPREAAEEGSAR